METNNSDAVVFGEPVNTMTVKKLQYTLKKFQIPFKGIKLKADLLALLINFLKENPNTDTGDYNSSADSSDKSSLSASIVASEKTSTRTTRGSSRARMNAISPVRIRSPESTHSLRSSNKRSSLRSADSKHPDYAGMAGKGKLEKTATSEHDGFLFFHKAPTGSEHGSSRDTGKSRQAPKRNHVHTSTPTLPKQSTAKKTSKSVRSASTTSSKSNLTKKSKLETNSRDQASRFDPIEEVDEDKHDSESDKDVSRLESIHDVDVRQEHIHGDTVHSILAKNAKYTVNKSDVTAAAVAVGAAQSEIAAPNINDDLSSKSITSFADESDHNEDTGEIDSSNDHDMLIDDEDFENLEDQPEENVESADSAADGYDDDDEDIVFEDAQEGDIRNVDNDEEDDDGDEVEEYGVEEDDHESREQEAEDSDLYDDRDGAEDDEYNDEATNLSEKGCDGKSIVDLVSSEENEEPEDKLDEDLPEEQDANDNDNAVVEPDNKLNGKGRPVEEETPIGAPSVQQHSVEDETFNEAVGMAVLRKLGTALIKLAENNENVTSNGTKNTIPTGLRLSVEHYNVLKSFIEQNKPSFMEKLRTPAEKLTPIDTSRDEEGALPTAQLSEPALVSQENTSTEPFTASTKTISFAAHDVTVPTPLNSFESSTIEWNSRTSFLPSTPAAGCVASDVAAVATSSSAERRKNLARRLPTPYNQSLRSKRPSFEIGGQDAHSTDTPAVHALTGKLERSDEQPSKRRMTASTASGGTTGTDDEQRRHSFGANDTGIVDMGPSYAASSTGSIPSASSATNYYDNRVNSTFNTFSASRVFGTSVALLQPNQRLPHQVMPFSPYQGTASHRSSYTPTFPGSTPVNRYRSYQPSINGLIHPSTGAAGSGLTNVPATTMSQSTQQQLQKQQVLAQPQICSRIAPGTAPSLSYMQRRRLQRQSEGAASSAVAKRILDTLGNMAPPMEEQRRRPVAINWNDDKAVDDKRSSGSATAANALIHATGEHSQKAVVDEAPPSGTNVKLSGAELPREKVVAGTSSGEPHKPTTTGKQPPLFSASSFIHSSVRREALVKEGTVGDSNAVSITTITSPDNKPKATTAGFEFGAVEPANTRGDGSIVPTRGVSFAPSATIKSTLLQSPAVAMNIAATSPATASSIADHEFTFEEPVEVRGVEDGDDDGDAEVGESNDVLGVLAPATTPASSSILSNAPHRKRKGTPHPSTERPSTSEPRIKYAFTPAGKSRKQRPSKTPAAVGKVPPDLLTGATSDNNASLSQKLVGAVDSNGSNIWAISSISAGIKCSVCMVKNEKGATKCVSCESALAEGSKDVTATKITEPTNLSTNIWASSSINDGIKCGVCMVKNKKGATKCVSCENSLNSIGKVDSTVNNQDNGNATGSTPVENSTAKIGSGGFTFGVPATDTFSTSTASKSVSGASGGEFTFGSKNIAPAATSTTTNTVDKPSLGGTFTGFTFGANSNPFQTSSATSLLPVAESTKIGNDITDGDEKPNTKRKILADDADKPKLISTMVNDDKKDAGFGIPALGTTTTVKPVADSAQLSANNAFTAPISTSSNFSFEAAPTTATPLDTDVADQSSKKKKASVDTMGLPEAPTAPMFSSTSASYQTNTIAPATATSTITLASGNSTFTFGSNSNNSISSSTENKNSFSFGRTDEAKPPASTGTVAPISSSVDSTPATAPFMFGNTAPVSSAPFVFGGSDSTASKAVSNTSINSGELSTASAPVFGVGNKPFTYTSEDPNKSSSTDPLPAVINSTNTASATEGSGKAAFIFGASVDSKKPSSSETATPSGQVSTPAFTFGSIPTASTPSSSSSTLLIGADTNSGNKPPLSSATSSSSMSATGAPFAFGGVASIGSNSHPASTSAPTAFGSAPPSASATTAATAPVVPAFGMDSPNSTMDCYGGGSNLSAPQPVSTFGSTATSTAGTTGSSAMPTTTANPFGGVSSSPFIFGATPATNNTAVTGSANASAVATTSGSSPFVFGSSGSFGQSNAAPTATPAATTVAPSTQGFGGANAPFTFGAASSGQAAATPTTSFSMPFGASQPGSAGGPALATGGGGPFGITPSNSGVFGSNSNLVGATMGAGMGGAAAGGNSAGFSLGAPDKQKTGAGGAVRRKVKAKRPGGGQ